MYIWEMGTINNTQCMFWSEQAFSFNWKKFEILP